MISLSDLKAYLKVNVDTYDDILTALESRAVAIVEHQLRWYFGEPREVKEVLDGTGRPRMFLNQTPVDGVISLLESRSGVGDDWGVVSTDDYEVEGRGLHALSAYVFYKGRRNFRATYQEGFATAPEDIQQVVLDLVAAIWNRRSHEGFSSESIGDYSYTVEDLNNLPRWITVMNNWRRGRI